MLVLSKEDGAAIIEVKRPGTLLASCICLNVYSIVACELVERSYISTSIVRVAIVKARTK